MPKYVEVESTKEFASTFLNDIFFRMAVNRTLDAAPAADVAEVVHGRWLEYPDEYQICATEFECSCCKTSFVNSELCSDNDFREMMKYCPNCGADMRERKNDD